MILEPNLILISVVALIGLAAFAAAVSGRFGGRRETGPTPGVRGVVDRSLGMFVLRHLAGRPTAAPPADLSGPERAAGVTPERTSSPGGTVVPIRARTSVYGMPPKHLPQPLQEQRPAAGGRFPRRQLVRDAGVALAGLAVVALVAVALWPAGVPPEGGVLGVTNGAARAGSPTGLLPAVSPSGADASGRIGPSTLPSTLQSPATAEAPAAPVVTAAAAATPRPDATARPPRTANPTARPTAKPNATPGPTATAGQTPVPTPTPEATAAPTPTPVPTPVASFSCSASGLMLTCDGTASTDATGYHWTFGDGTTASVAQPSHTYAAAGTFSVRLTVTNASGSDSRSQEYALG